MDALVMCGGRGTRLDAAGEKPLVEVGGVPMIDRVRDALAASRVETVHCVVSSHAPATRDHLESMGASVIDGSGDGYVADLDTGLAAVERPVLTVAADLPLLAAEPVNRVLDRAEGSLAVMVPVALKRRLGVSVDTTVEHEGKRLTPTGVNVVAGTDDDIYVSDDRRLAVNVNHDADRQVAEALA
ncbi:NTP transferase domain-containing protein [Haloplanus halobius]|uniref:NTP transferase domain-containing protein n=1 Tax=Haloplanus halobius TaxID=2934938 RepID=UPI0020102DB6|nr:NTP transferase domain-containing protein [Haloplanus sp. XH21]